MRTMPRGTTSELKGFNIWLFFLIGVERLHGSSYVSDTELKDDTFYCHREQ